LYNILRSKALLYIELAPAYLLDIVWSPARPLVFALADSVGKVHVYDLLESVLEPILVVNVSDQERITSVAFNKSDPSILAASTQSGSIIVYQLGARLSTLQSGEQAVCDKMGSAEL
jgi:WD40 repeat protein